MEGLPFDLEFVVNNKNAQIKCPHCGSMDTARYIYGYPLYNEEMKNKLEAGKWVLGGCCIDTVEVNGEPVNMMATRKCNKCKKGFGTPPVHYSAKKNLADDYRDIVRSISFSEGGFFPGYTTIDIKKKPDGAIVKVDRMIQDGFIQERRISEAKWQEILNRLYCEYYLHEWKKKYDDPYILDGTQWCLEVRFSGDSIGRGFRHYSGSNAFPPYWNEVKKIFWQFLKK